MNIGDYLDQVRAQYDSGHATEHSYRPALQGLFDSIDPALTIVNEPKRSDAGMPDFLFQRGDVPVGWAEAKDIDKDVIRLKGYSIEQRKRYEKAFPNLIYTNGVDFEFIRDAEPVHFVSIADFLMGLQPNPDRFDELARQLKNFAEEQPVTIKSAQKLAELMAAKAAIIKDEIGIALSQDAQLRSTLASQYKGFKADLLPNLTTGEFADIYAETITYGMFAARLHDTSLDTFSRAEALELLPKSNPFLRDLFGYIAGPAIPDRLRYIVDDLAAVLRASDPHSLFQDFGKFTARNDPFVHFYETFLAEYNPKKRKSRGVWYTPEPVVDFIVRAVDDVLKTEFGLADGLADTSKVTVDWDTGETDKKGEAVTVKREMHRVQILDPATGTGTFLAKTIQTISDRVKKRAPGKWSGYVESDLIPRLHGFELLMASYAMCHMKLDMMLRDTGYTPSDTPPRLSVWLTNALEEGEREVRDLFFTALADEARGASEVKRQTPIMCIIGNPPYSGESANKGNYIMGLMEAYKKEPGGKHKLQERNPKWINDDYVKFIRMSENMIAQNGEGILGFITNHGYLDNPTFRGMRWHLLNTFDKIYVLDLHGNAKKKEVSPDGSPDKNVFDIQQGVALFIGVKKAGANKEKPLAEVWHGDLWGNRKAKNEALWANGRSDLLSEKLPNKGPQFPFVQRDFELEESYRSGFSVADLMQTNSIGVVTGADKTLVNSAKSPSINAAEIGDSFNADLIQTFSYRPFERANIYYCRNKIERDRWEVMQHYLSPKVNLGLLTTKALRDHEFAHVFVTTQISEAIFLSGTTASNAMNFPLYLYPDEESEQGDAFAATGRSVNFDPALYAEICARAGLEISSPLEGEDQGEGPAASAAEKTLRTDAVKEVYSAADAAGPSSGPSGHLLPQGEKDDSFRTLSGDDRPSEVKVFDYIYGVLHSPEYRETYREFLKIDFPRIPFPKDPESFAHVSEKGEALRRLHLMEAGAIGDALYRFEGEGDDAVAAGYPKWEAVKPSPLQGRGLGEGAERREASVNGGTDSPSPSGADAPPPSPLKGRGVGRVYINPAQYFANVPKTAWEFHIGGYQPARKWLKDRKGRALSWDDIGHYQKIVKILIETDRIMGEIELPLD